MMLAEKCGALICIILACAMTSYGQQASDQGQISMAQKYPELDSVIHDIFGTNGKTDPKQQITTTERGSKLNKQIENNNRNISLKDILQPNWESKNEPINKEYLEKSYKKSFGATTRTTERNGSSKEAVERSDQFMKDLFGENWDQENKHVNQATPKEAVTNFGGSDSKSNGSTLNKEKNEDYDTFFRNVFGANWDNENKPINELFKNNIRINAGGSSGLGVDGSDKGLESKFGTIDTSTPPNSFKLTRVCPCKIFTRPFCSRSFSHSRINYIKPRLKCGDYPRIVTSYLKIYPHPVSFHSYVNGIWRCNND